MKKILSVFLMLSLFVLPAEAQTKPRARDLGIPFGGVTGQFNAITDVKGIEVGYATLISGEGKQAIRTGVTAILPQGKSFSRASFRRLARA
jgi:hypothetical protein